MPIRPPLSTVTISHTSADYPSRLGRITDPPETIYVRGIIKHTAPALAVVGTRRMTPYGRIATETIVPSIARAGVTIVSGLAFGIDATAHAACLAVGGHTIAVLAGGVDDNTIAPKTNAPLAQQMLASGGALVSEFPDGHPPEAYAFAQRNRMIAGLADAVLVVEAPEDSGALITARLALEYDRDVLVIPGPITSPMSAGTNALLRLGAVAITSPEDLIEALSLTAQAPLPLIPTPTDPLHEKILTFMAEPTTIDTIVRASSLDIATVVASLAIMEIHGLVKPIAGNRYTRTHGPHSNYR